MLSISVCCYEFIKSLYAYFPSPTKKNNDDVRRKRKKVFDLLLFEAFETESLQLLESINSEKLIILILQLLTHMKIVAPEGCKLSLSA